MRDLRLALRSLRATPVVSAVAILSLALGIGANTAIFSILESLLLRPLPVGHAARLALLDDAAGRGSYWTNPIWEEIRSRTQFFDGAFAWAATRFDVSRSAQTEFIDGIWASGGIFDVLGVPAAVGRTFTDADDRRGGGPDGAVAVISYSYWQRRYGGTPDVIGRSITLNRVPFTIVGVAARSFHGPTVGRTFDVAVPIGTEPLIHGADSALDRRSTWWLGIMVRLKPGQTPEAATTALRGVQPQIREATLPDGWRPQDLRNYLDEAFAVTPAAIGTSSLRARYQRPVIVLMVVVGLVLLVACANIANLLLARATARRHELSVRRALGASRWSMARLLLVESLVLSVAGALLGLLFAHWGSRLLVAQLSTATDTVFLDLAINWPVLGFTAGIAVTTAILFGTVPALRAARVEPADALAEQGRSTMGTGRGSPGSALLVAQVALSLVLVLGGGLFLRTFSTLANRDLGFDRHPILVANVSARRSATRPADRLVLFERIREAALRVPGVAGAAASVLTPVSGNIWNDLIEVPGGPPLPERERIAFINFVTPGWFATFGTALLAGRDFTAHDGQGSTPVIIVNQAFQRRFLPGASPLGQTVRRIGAPQPPPPAEIVGVVEDAAYRSLRDPVPPIMYFPLAQMETASGPGPSVNISIRSAGPPPSTLIRSVTRAFGDIDPDLSLTFRLLDEQVNAALIQERLLAMVCGFFAGLALLLAGLGLYGVTSYSVHRRRAEIGIRMALGASPVGVVRCVLGRVGVLVAAGIVIGAAAGLWAAHFVETLLFGLEPRDPATLAVAAGVLTTVAAVAGWLPARRAARVDPARVLREN
jgi:putative ABC transport system permease protein